MKKCRYLYSSGIEKNNNHPDWDTVYQLPGSTPDFSRWVQIGLRCGLSKFPSGVEIFWFSPIIFVFEITAPLHPDRRSTQYPAHTSVCNEDPHILSDLRVQIVPLVLLSSIFKAGLSFAFISTSFDLNPYLHPISTWPAPAGAVPSDNSGSTFKLFDKR